jgi:HEAT repeat protein
VQAPTEQAPAAPVAAPAEVQPLAEGGVAEKVEGGPDPFQQWLAIANTSTREKPMIEETVALAPEIMNAYAGKPNPLLGVLADKASAPVVKVLATLSLQTILDPTTIDSLIEMLKPEYDNTTRACVTDLLGVYKGASVDEALKAVANDPDRRVRFLALRGLAIRDPEKRKELHQWWSQADATADERSRIVETLTSGLISDSVWLFMDAAGRKDLPEGIRVTAIDMAGRAGSETCIEQLSKYAETDSSEAVRAAAATAVAAIKERMQNPPQIVEVPTGAAAQAPVEASAVPPADAATVASPQ